MRQVTRMEKPHSLIGQMKERLLIVIGLFTFLLIFHIAISSYILNSQNALNQQKLALHETVSSLMSEMVEQSTDLRGYIITKDREFKTKFDTGRSQYLATVASLNDAIRKGDFIETSTVLRAVESSAEDWYSNFARKQLKNIETGHATQADTDATVLAGKKLFDLFRARVAQLQRALNNDITRLQHQQDAVNTWSVVITVLLAAVTIFLFWRIFTRFISALSTQLAILRETSLRLGQGDFTARVRKLGYDELNVLGRTFNDMVNALQQQQQQLSERDVLEHVLQLNTILTSTLNFDALAKEFLNSVLMMFELHVAALYLYYSKEEVLRLVSVQGFDYERIEKEFRLGEGMVGRAGLTRSAIYQVQPDHEQAKNLQVKTLVGDALPTSIYCLPLSHGEELLGVLAVGSLFVMPEKARNALSVVSSNLAATISNSHAYHHIRRQAEELIRRSREQEQTNIELRRQRDKLTQLNEALEEANQARSQFLSTMSHELRTPLTSIIGFSQILLDDLEREGGSPRFKKNLERIQRNGKHLLNMINDVLDLSKIDTGHIDFIYSEIELPELLNAIVEEMQAIALEQQLELTWNVEAGAERLETDAGKLHRLLLNLVSNALKFTRQGRVTVRATRGRPLDGEETIAIAVEDTGIGISREAQERIFEAFYQVDSGSTRKYGGTGLGLSIVRQLAELLGGQITLESMPGKGSIFTLTLPVRVRVRQAMAEVAR